MPVHSPKDSTQALDKMVKFRLEAELKRKLADVARKHRKNTAQFVREKLWQIVDEDAAAIQRQAL
jgi:predicted DNA-binding protein